MSEHRGFDIDDETGQAWRSFAARLADSIAGMGEGSSFTIRLAGLVESEAPRLTFTVVRQDTVRCTVEAPAPRRHRDDGRRELDPQHDVAPDHAVSAALSELGWRLAPTSPEGQWTPDTIRARRDMAFREADELSALVVQLLYDVFGALHPVFLRVVGQADLVDYSATGADTSTDDEAQPPVTEPIDPEHLRELVARTIADELGREPVRDSDGDLMIETTRARVFVRILQDDSVIHLFARLVHAVAHESEAPPVIAKLNAQYSFIKFMFAEGSAFACVHLPATPFVPVQLRRMLATFVEIAENVGADLEERLGGSPDVEGSTDDGAEPDAIPPELVTLLGLDPEGTGLDPEVTASVCGDDKALARQLLHIASGQEEAWRSAMAETDDPDEETRCAEEAAGWKATRLSLAGALDLINARSR